VPEYCGWKKDKYCYIDGWPKCCRVGHMHALTHILPYRYFISSLTAMPIDYSGFIPQDAWRCPYEWKPECNKYKRPWYCDECKDYRCYEDGLPSCCFEHDGRYCPKYKPDCDRRRPPWYCDDDERDYRCYQKGWPKCCLNHHGEYCPEKRPKCDRDWYYEREKKKDSQYNCYDEKEKRWYHDKGTECDRYRHRWWGHYRTCEDNWNCEVRGLEGKVVLLSSFVQSSSSDRRNRRTPLTISTCLCLL